MAFLSVVLTLSGFRWYLIPLEVGSITFHPEYFEANMHIS